MSSRSFVKLGGLIPALLLLGAGCGDDGKTVGPERLCGNQVCEEGETALLCPEDCGCGNFIVNDGEDCDGPNLDGQSCIGLGYQGGTLTCSPQCEFNTIMCIGNVCGNDLIEVNEHCEGTNLDGQSCSSLGFDSGILICSAQCTFDTSGCEGQGCGDGVKDPGEDCDGADLGGADCTDVGYASGTLACTGTCTYDTVGCDTPLLCGNGVVDQDEECDDGQETASCDLDCTLAQCGDGLRNQTAGEDCDDGFETAACDTDCTPAECLDGMLNMAAGETCDDATETATCDLDCTAAQCGDQTVNQTAGETCDDGTETATCDDDCTAAQCGDGNLNTTAGEVCDDGGESVNCDNDCTPAECGDQTVNQTAGETCDDGNHVDQDGCDANCHLECGNGVIDTGEICDDGGESATCDSDCTPALCGDGTLNQTAGETCDDGNNIDGDGCSAICIMECDPTENIALTVGVIPSSSGGGETQHGYGPEKMIDGYLEPSCSTENFHWIDADDFPNGEWIELEFPATVTVARVAFDTTEANDNTCSSNTGRSLAGGDIQWHDGAGWVTAGTVSGQTDDWDFILPAAVQTTRIRLFNAHATDVGTQNSNPVVLEWMVYQCN